MTTGTAVTSWAPTTPRLLLALSGWAALLATGLTPANPVRVLVTAVFVLGCPGTAAMLLARPTAAGLARQAGPVAAGTVALALSGALATVTATALFLTDSFTTGRALLVLAGLTTLLALVPRRHRPGREQADREDTDRVGGDRVGGDLAGGDLAGGDREQADRQDAARDSARQERADRQHADAAPRRRPPDGRALGRSAARLAGAGLLLLAAACGGAAGRGTGSGTGTAAPRSPASGSAEDSPTSPGGGQGGSSSGGPNGVAAPAAPGPWHQVFRDDFNGSTLNRADWATCFDWNDQGCTNAGNNEQEWYQPGQVSVAGGALTLTAERRTTAGSDGNSYPWASGMVTTGRDSWTGTPRHTYTYGYYAAALQVPLDAAGMFPAFWLIPADTRSTPPELDVAEFINTNQRVDMNLHWRTADGGDTHVGQTTGPADYASGFHVFAMDWEPNAVTWYVDGVQRFQVTKPAMIPNVPMELVINLAVGFQEQPPASVASAQLHVDWVGVWQH
ncbi:hypothetical protein GCM10009760_40260 [Kitasatospora kazusensis]|uniref:GH16 domain-containing protein n=1 Tax=Kitasatospora kazusensis TaxID=407974 RepID=A0ABN2ZVG5_9ACTN